MFYGKRKWADPKEGNIYGFVFMSLPQFTSLQFSLVFIKIFQLKTDFYPNMFWQFSLQKFMFKFLNFFDIGFLIFNFLIFFSPSLPSSNGHARSTYFLE